MQELTRYVVGTIGRQTNPLAQGSSNRLPSITSPTPLPISSEIEHETTKGTTLLESSTPASLQKRPVPYIPDHTREASPGASGPRDTWEASVGLSRKAVGGPIWHNAGSGRQRNAISKRSEILWILLPCHPLISVRPRVLKQCTAGVAFPLTTQPQVG